MIYLIFGKFYWLNAQRQTLKARTSLSNESIKSSTKFQAQLIQSYPETERVARISVGGGDTGVTPINESKNDLIVLLDMNGCRFDCAVSPRDACGTWRWARGDLGNVVLLVVFTAAVRVITPNPGGGSGHRGFWLPVHSLIFRKFY